MPSGAWLRPPVGVLPSRPSGLARLPRGPLSGPRLEDSLPTALASASPMETLLSSEGFSERER